MYRLFLTLLMLFPAFLLFGQELSRVDSLKEQLDIPMLDSLKILTAMDLSRALHNQNAHEEDLVYATMATEQAERFGDTLLYGRALDNLGLIYRFHQHYGKSLPLHVKAYELIKDQQVKPYYKMRFANNAAVAARHDQLYDQAVAFYIYALRIAEAEQDLRNIAISSNGLGNTFIDIPERKDQALEYFLKALKAEEEQKNTRGIAINYLSLGDYFSQKEQFDTAKVYLEKLLKINEEMNDQYGLGVTYEFFGHNTLRQGVDLNQAKIYYLKSLEIFEKIKNRSKQADLLHSLGDLFLKEGKANQAKEHYYQSLEIAKQLHHKQAIKDNTEELAALYEKESDFKQALDYYKISQIYRDSINLMEQETQIAGIKLAYDFEKKEAEIELLKRNRNIQEAELYIQSETLKKHKATVYLILGGFVIGLSFFLLIYRNLNFKKNSRLLLQEQERKRLRTEYENNLLQAEILASRMQMNPHFLFNCLNSIKYLIQTQKFTEAINYLTIFSRFVRSVLETGKKKDIALSEELDLIKKYVHLEENRFDQNFVFNINYIGMEPSLMEEIHIPPLLLQPFVENAIWHGLLASKKEKKRLDISVERDGVDILIIVEDNGVGRRNLKVGPTVDLHKSMGTRMTQDRINLFNKNSECKISFEIMDILKDLNESLGTKVIITLRGITKRKDSFESNLSV